MSRTSHNTLTPFTSKDRILVHFHHPFNNTIQLVAYHKFGAPFAALKFIQRVIKDDDTNWKSSTLLSVNKDWLRISTDPGSSHTLEELMDHKLSKEERAWELDAVWQNYADTIHSFVRGSHPDINSHTRQQKGLPPLNDEQLVAVGIKLPTKTTDRRTDPAPSPKRQPKTRERLGVTLQSLCITLKIEPKEARTALRKANVTKPDAGWVWPDSSNVPDIAALVSRLRKGKTK